MIMTSDRLSTGIPELNGIPPLLGAATRQPIRGGRPTSARVQLPLLKSIRHRDGSSTPDDVVHQHHPSYFMQEVPAATLMAGRGRPRLCSNGLLQHWTVNTRAPFLLGRSGTLRFSDAFGG